MNTYKVIWIDDDNEKHESLIEAHDEKEAETRIFMLNDNWADTCGVVRVKGA